jgi:hypothetical protein
MIVVCELRHEWKDPTGGKEVDTYWVVGEVQVLQGRATAPKILTVTKAGGEPLWDMSRNYFEFTLKPLAEDALVSHAERMFEAAVHNEGSVRHV